MPLVYAKTSCVTSNDGGRVRLKAGDAFDDTDPVVLAHPDLFGSEPTKVRSTAVEDATAEPGKKRRTRA